VSDLKLRTLRLLVAADRRQLRAYTYVEGASLTGLILEVREEFWSRRPYEPDDFRQPNSIRHVTIDVFEDKSQDTGLSVLRDLLVADGGFVLTATPEAMFRSADTPGAYLVDVVCAAVQDVLERDPDIAAEDRQRKVLAAESLAGLQDKWRDAGIATD
jgi:hypothetical protein